MLAQTLSFKEDNVHKLQKEQKKIEREIKDLEERVTKEQSNCEESLRTKSNHLKIMKTYQIISNIFKRLLKYFISPDYKM